MNSNNDNIFIDSENFFKNLIENKTAIMRARVYGIYQCELERKKEENEAYELVVNKESSNANLRVYGGATKIQDGVFIVELNNYMNIEKPVYTPVVNSKKIYTVFSTFDEALLCAIAMKNGTDTNGVKYAGMILGINGE